MALAECVTNSAVNVAMGYSPFFLNSSDHLLVPLVLMHNKSVLGQIEIVQTLLDQMKTALEEAQANLTITELGQMTSGLLEA